MFLSEVEKPIYEPVSENMSAVASFFYKIKKWDDEGEILMRVGTRQGFLRAEEEFFGKHSFYLMGIECTDAELLWLKEVIMKKLLTIEKNKALVLKVPSQL